MTKVQATKEELGQFEQFLIEMDDVLEAFIADAKDAGVDLDYSMESLDRLEVFIDSLTERVSADQDLIKNRAGSYLGEVFRRHIGGRWELCLKDPNYLYFKRPVLTGYSRTPIEFSPISIVGNYINRRKAGLLRTAVAANEMWKA